MHFVCRVLRKILFFVICLTKVTLKKIIGNIRVKGEVVLPANRKSVVPNTMCLALLFLALPAIESSSMRRVCNCITRAIFVSLIRYPLCCKELDSSDLRELHQCHYDKCLISHKKGHVLDHQCFIQRVDPKDDEKKKKSNKQLQKHRKINPNASSYVEPPDFV